MIHWKADRCCDVVPITLDWLWPRYIPRSKLCIVDGDPEMGKSLVTIDLIARLSRGGPLPDGSPLAEPAVSILLSTEDDAADTIRPRAEAAGADLTRLIIPNFDGHVPRLPHDLSALEELVTAHRAALVVIDPLMAFLPPSVAANLDQCVRQVLTPLTGLAARTGCCVLFVRHLTKQSRHRAIQRGQGSMGIVAAVRTALFIGPHTAPAPLDLPPPLEDSHQLASLRWARKKRSKVEAPPPTPAAPAPAPQPTRVLAVAKSNVGRRPPTLGFRIVESASGQPVIEWTGPLDRTADDASRDRSTIRMRERAVDWLKRELANGPRRAAELRALAAEVDIPDRTLDRAKYELGVSSHRTWNDALERGEWWWYDPDAPWPDPAPFRKPRELPPLPPLD